MDEMYKVAINKIFCRELLFIGSESLIERYNKALESLTGKRTALPCFHIDKTGYSPEIAVELNDEDYLDCKGINKKFIIIDIAQREIPIIRSHFSSTGDFIKEFIEDNHESIFTLSALDSIYGELENNIYKIENLSDVINADKVDIHIETSKNLIDIAHHLNEKIEKLKNSPAEKWLNDEHLLEIVELSKKTGNIQHNSIIPTKTKYAKSSYFTSHFGGLYIFKGLKEPHRDQTGISYIISMDNKELPKYVPEDIQLIDGSNRLEVYEFLQKFNLIYDFAENEVGTLKDNMVFKKYQIINDYISMDIESSSDILNKLNIKSKINDYFESLPENFHKLYRLLSNIEREECNVHSAEEYLFYPCRVSEDVGKSTSGVLNHLLSNYTSSSYMRTIMYNPDLFMLNFNSWPDSKKKYVIRYLQQQMDSME